MFRPSLLRARAAWRPSGVRFASQEAHAPRSAPTAGAQQRPYRVAVQGVLLSLLLTAGFSTLGEGRSTVAHLDSGVTRKKGARAVGLEELAAHAGGKQGSWIVLDGEVYDVTDFLTKHPGGAGVISQRAGTDCTEVFQPLHPSNALDTLPPSAHIGSLADGVAAPMAAPMGSKKVAAGERPEIGAVLNLDEFELIAQEHLSDQAWAYYSSAGDDEITKAANRAAYGRVYFRPRILRRVGEVDPTVPLLGAENGERTLPFYISPAAMAKLGHPDGELNLTRAAGQAGVVQGISANASVSLDEMLTARIAGQPLMYQLYVNRDRAASEKILRHVEASGVNAVMLTVDAPVMGKRERDMRCKGEVVSVGGGTGTSSEAKGVAQAISQYIDADLSWDIIDWYHSVCKLPLFLKGIQTVEDAILASEHGVQGIVLSNHGGRSLDYSPPPLDVLIELRERRPDLLESMHVYIDGGVRRGTDVLKALALGARGVGLGRPFLYAQSGYGEEGALRAIDILKDEIERGMRLLGITSLDELGPHMIDILPRVAYVPPVPSHAS
ncbi:hypothetical protein FA09DRAFT_330297 [Tilletiopsis washingtonensis]|uniref:L-lactate dehydrogenase (cytochrome) n=1 Tax=Tilletiopsis washingtonensis TaxID=58919 RepID=A0A316Z786_9BASI|nr:hypothetical protein FA09DRAFT_330297 [Tilletiopsis washingtonensis]PWN97630.1 hypothetical protein FA09DRAFT_330297 [Tilletiopsis washingtonensis]